MFSFALFLLFSIFFRPFILRMKAFLRNFPKLSWNLSILALVLVSSQVRVGIIWSIKGLSFCIFLFHFIFFFFQISRLFKCNRVIFTKSTLSASMNRSFLKKNYFSDHIFTFSIFYKYKISESSYSSFSFNSFYTIQKTLSPASFSISFDKKYLLLTQNVRKLFRHSYLAQYTVFDIQTR